MLYKKINFRSEKFDTKDQFFSNYKKDQKYKITASSRTTIKYSKKLFEKCKV